jgi:hypothetical protein
MKTLHAFLGIAAIIISSQAFGEYYENPYKHLYELKVGDYATTSTIKRVNGGLPVETTAKVEVLRKKDYHGTEIQTEKITETEFGNDSFPKTTISYKDYAGGWLIRLSSEDSEDVAIGEIVSVIGKDPEKELLEIGEEWEITATEMLNVTLSEYVKATGTFTTVIRYRFLGLETISTAWGPLQAAKIRETYTQSRKFNEQIAALNGDPYKITMTPIETNGEVTCYYLKGFGKYKSSASQTQGAWSEQDLNLRTQSRDDFDYPAESTTSETTFVSSNFNVTPTSFSAITPTEYASTAYLDEWTWVGQFPWVYNASTSSWFYYRFNGNACYAYDVRTGSWYAFDGQQKTWVNAN